VLLQVPKSLPKIKTKKYYKYYKNQNDAFDVFYNKDLAILEKSQNTIFAYENTIVIGSREYIINKVIRDFALVYRIKPHNINKEHTIQHKIDSIVNGLKTLIKENAQKYNSLAYTQKPFRVCFVKLHSNRRAGSFIIYYEFSPETMNWVSTGTNKLDPSCDDCKRAIDDCDEIIRTDIILNRYYVVDCYVGSEDDVYGTYFVSADEEDYESPRDYFTSIYDLLTGKMVYNSVSHTREAKKGDSYASYTLKLNHRAFMFVGTNLHIIPIGQYNRDILKISIGSAALRPDGHEIFYTFDMANKGEILYILRNLQFNQIFFIYNSSYVRLAQKDSSTPTFSYKGSHILNTNSTLKNIFLHKNNFFTILIKSEKENILRSICMYYDLKNDLYKYKLLDLTELIYNIESIREAKVIGKILSKNNNNDCVGLVITTNANHVITILYEKNTDQFIARYFTNYDKILNLIEYHKNKIIYAITIKSFTNEGLRIEFLPTKNNIFRNRHVSPKLDSDHVVINVKAENKISVFCNKITHTKNRVEEAITPDTYHNLDSSVQECYFECVDPILVYSCKRE